MDAVNENALFKSDDVFRCIDFVQKAKKLINVHPPEHCACVIDINAPWVWARYHCQDVDQ